MPEEDENRLFPIDIEHIAKQARIHSILQFNAQYKSQGLQINDGTKVKTTSPHTWSDSKLEEIMEIEEVNVLIKESLEYDKNEEKYLCSKKKFSAIVEKIMEKLFYKICMHFVDAGIYELAFDGETESFMFKIKDHKKLVGDPPKKRGRPKKKPPTDS